MSIFVDAFVQDLGIKLYAEDGSVVNQSNAEGVNPEIIQTILEAGLYYAEVFPVGGSRTNYNLSVNIVS
ncbi:hypothetical protein [Okeania sp.]|uniref:hypothetical protein n=1 Tax=Okeania sp. TaxID=3100323 RepID=UPI002B4B54BD|nr:hypothetical protein [Okeania sp.]MEB3339516.1 hypothetical protein [Okeania sp.]